MTIKLSVVSIALSFLPGLIIATILCIAFTELSRWLERRPGRRKPI